MSHFKLVHEQNCDPARFWGGLPSTRPSTSPSTSTSAPKERKFLEMHDLGATKTWVLRVFPERDLPDFVKKIIKGDLGYIEHATMDKARNRIDCRIEPTLFKDKTKITAVYTVESIGPNKVRRTFEGDVEVSFPLNRPRKKSRTSSSTGHGEGVRRRRRLHQTSGSPRTPELVRSTLHGLRGEGGSRLRSLHCPAPRSRRPALARRRRLRLHRRE